MLLFIFFFSSRRRHTRLQGDWSSDVCSSDLDNYWNKQGGPYLEQIRYRPIPDDTVKLQSLQAGEIHVMDYVQPRDVAAVKIGRASCRERGAVTGGGEAGEKKKTEESSEGGRI